MRPASFGPVIIVVAGAESFCSFRQPVGPMNIIKHQKKIEKNRKKTHIWPKQRKTHRLGPFSLVWDTGNPQVFLPLPLPRPIPTRYPYPGHGSRFL